jgi:NAD(P)-dependent dehydrogenase (short-subunit alcohol dehydrogenase family)
MNECVQVAIVTGANTGIGKITVRDLAQKGAHVVLASRSTSKGEAARQEVCASIGKKDKDEEEEGDSECPVTVLALDLASLDSVLAFSSRVTARFDRIDMLILNAGIMFGEYATTAEGYERQWGTNHLGHFFLVQRLLPVLSSSQARVVTVSSSAHQHPYAGGIAFDQLDSDLNYSPLYVH